MSQHEHKRRLYKREHIYWNSKVNSFLDRSEETNPRGTLNPPSGYPTQISCGIFGQLVIESTELLLFVKMYFMLSVALAASLAALSSLGDGAPTVVANNVTLATRACLPPHDQYPFCNTSLDIDTRVQACCCKTVVCLR